MHSDATSRSSRAHIADRFGLRRVAFVFLSGLTFPAIAGPPFVTDDPEPVDYHHYEFYVASAQTLSSNGRTGTLPHFEFNYGAYPDIQLHIVAPLAFSDPRDGKRQWGYGDTELGIKYRFIEETDDRPMVGIFPLVEVDTGSSSRGLGNGAIQIFLPVWVQKKWGEWQTYFGGGYWIDQAVDARSHWFFGWQLQRNLSEHLTLGGEIFHSTEHVPHQGSSSGFNVGGFYNFTEHHHFLFSTGRGLSNANETNKFSTYVAYQLTH